MELWIRSQNKTRLIKANNILEYQFSDGNYGIQINGECFVGEYKTKERALEVLDDIQKFILRDLKIINSSYQNADIEIKSKSYVDDSKIYEMPKE